MPNINIEAMLQSIMTSTKRLSDLNATGRLTDAHWLHKDLKKVEHDLDDIVEVFEPE